MRFLILGGGIAAVQCVEELARLCPLDLITLVSPTSHLKGIRNSKKLSRTVEEFEVVQFCLDEMAYPNVTALKAAAKEIKVADKSVLLDDGSCIPYDRLCISVGASPKKAMEHPRVMVLRDQRTVEDLASRLAHARRIILVGNGGIAMELAYALQGVEVIWAMKHGHMGDAFFDIDAAGFLSQQLQTRRKKDEAAKKRAHGEQQCDKHITIKSSDAHESSKSASVHVWQGSPGKANYGHAVGPQWAADLVSGAQPNHLHLENGCSISDIVDTSGEWPILVKLSNGKSFKADFVISAVGVAPNTAWLPETLHLDPEDGGILVNEHMESSAEDVFAAGDVCCIRWPNLSKHWFQMRLWTQAKVMGAYAAHCMARREDSVPYAFNFELFTHVTRFMGLKVVLLGLYNGQTIPESEADNLVSYSRCLEAPESSFVRVLLHKHKMVGAVLIGETDLEETFENLILDGLDLSRYGPALLDPDFEIDHIFD